MKSKHMQKQLGFNFSEWIDRQHGNKSKCQQLPESSSKHKGSFEHKVPECRHTRRLETCKSQQIWKNQRIKVVRPPHTTGFKHTCKNSDRGMRPIR